MSSLVVMGVSGCGKSSVGVDLAARLQMPLIEGDDFHSPANRARMRAGDALSDADRAQWLEVLAERLSSSSGGAVLTCSALKRSYRDTLRRACPGLRFAWLDIDKPSALARVSQRGASHFFPATLVESQLQTLEPPSDEPDTLRLDALLAVQTLGDQILAWLSRADATHASTATCGRREDDHQGHQK